MNKIENYVSSVLRITVLEEIIEAFSALMPLSIVLSMCLLITKNLPGLGSLHLLIQNNATWIFLCFYVILGYHLVIKLNGSLRVQVLTVSMISFMYLHPNLAIEGLPIFMVWVLLIRKIATVLDAKLSSRRFDIDGVPTSVLDSVIALFIGVVIWLLVFLLSDIVGKSEIIGASFWFLNIIYSIITFMPVYMILVFVMLLLWTYGIHGDQIVGRLLDPFLIIFILTNLQNTLFSKPSFTAINASFHLVFVMGTGTGMTGMLLLALRFYDKGKYDYRSLAQGSLFNINEPIVFGLPIAFNESLRIPFILAPLVSMTFGWIMTILGYAKVMVYPVPWITPPLLKSFIASGGDWQTVFVEFISYVLAFCVYLIFIGINRNKKRVSL